MKTISVFDKKFSLTDSTEYSLSIQINLDGFSFLVRDLRTNKFCGLKHIPYNEGIHPDDLSKELNKVLSKEPLAEAPYASVQMVYWTPLVILIPESLFDTDHLKNYFEFNTELPENCALYHKKLKNIGAFIVYSIPSDIATIAGQYFNNIAFYCQSQPVIESALMHQKSGATGSRIYLQVTNGFFDITYMNVGKLVLQNCFKYSNPADFTYFVLNIFEQFNLNPESTPVFLSGSITKLSEEYFGISRYIRDLQFMSPTDMEETFTHAFTDKELHRYTTLTELSICE